jgi:hypothetical protein
MSKSLQKWLVAETLLSYGALLQVAVNREEFYNDEAELGYQ